MDVRGGARRRPLNAPRPGAPGTGVVLREPVLHSPLTTGEEAAVEVLEQFPLRSGITSPGVPRWVDVDEQAARESLREQIAKLERDLAAAFTSAYPRTGLAPGVARSAGGPRLLGLGELEHVRDDLSERLHAARAALSERAEAEEQNRLLIERMLLEPGSYKFVQVSREDIGERGCGHWHVRPRLGLIGMLMGWWHVKISSGCPLPGGRGPVPRPA